MQIELIETFLDVCDTRSFNKTAERLGVTQSTVSGRVQALEKALDCRLFNRNRSGTALTTEGLRFEPHARNLRIGWSEARQAAKRPGTADLSLRIGVQHDLAGAQIGDWVAAVRAALPDAAVYIEAEFSTQLCNDLMIGTLDLALVFTPKPHPDLHFETLGEVTYRMISTQADTLAGIDIARYIIPDFSPAFLHMHTALHPNLTAAPVSCGQNSVVAGLLTSLGGTGYVLDETAEALTSAGTCRFVRDAPPIDQLVQVVVHLRNRHRAPHRRMVELLRTKLLPQRAG